MTHPMTVMAVTLIIWLGLFIYLAALGSRLRRLERRIASLDRDTTPADES
ncbi:MAG: CcmD family protein [Armatimonadetes bacterium]|nr:CcmD family protein [Armatimonadota bacterium]PIU64186.1 MAG: hypothetical protein COS85_13435 [Armatimonadetes bacterium CG07_land_8_20_14_0_80_59_28]PIX40903.1 MAG: hypothetical protein COZ56_13495 [Armatimonadetes bacterium CG_4_8_14_3_um_filter_58_9]PIY48094.1 MAG: hypothetical protein COZ05_04125 [Armatimonadetes bacterium CG_4_10_14_3_um_filter_59_10]PJB74017.1 MAG: hypothetical protein CO095_05200 [Armatimonadetes bacterium CG_4_9_14_3_um_filter_58_7]